MTPDEVKAQVVERLLRVILSLLDMAGSKKFIAAFVAGITAYQATGDIWAFLLPVITAIAAQGLADMNKEKAKIDAVAIQELKK